MLTDCRYAYSCWFLAGSWLFGSESRDPLSAIQDEGGCGWSHLYRLRFVGCRTVNYVHHRSPWLHVHRHWYRIGVWVVHRTLLYPRASMFGSLLIPGICAMISQKPISLSALVILRNWRFKTRCGINRNDNLINKGRDRSLLYRLCLCFTHYP